ncbi:MAG: SIMPL domain-containing protein [Pseudorhodobacter sp.]
MRLAGIALFALCLAMPLGVSADTDDDDPSIIVTGQGKVEAPPDMATLSLGVQSEAATAAEAMAANSEQLGTVLANLRSAGVEDRDLQTSGLSLNPNWTRPREGQSPAIAGYRASNMLSVRVRNLDNLGTLIDAALADGANTLNGISFGVSDPEPLQQEARRRAVADARAQAELLTEAAGVELREVRRISAGGGSFQPEPPMFRSGAAMEMAVPVAEGEISVTASVSIEWEISNK